jgi:hypothetical protein
MGFPIRDYLGVGTERHLQERRPATRNSNDHYDAKPNITFQRHKLHPVDLDDRAFGR